jgi:MOSC domain-containing protein YiiM
VSASGRIVQLSISNGGVPKLPVDEARVTSVGLHGDAHRNHQHHGGPERAVCLYSMEAIRALIAEGHTVAPGALGENVTVEGLAWQTLSPGTYLRLGDRVLLQISRYTSPCFNIKASFKDGEYARVSQKRHPGWSRLYARVLVEGRIRTGDPVRILDEPVAAEHLADCGASMA